MQMIKMARRFYEFVTSKILCFILSTKSNVKLGKNVRFKKIPHLQIDQSAKLYIGNNVMINSDNRNYHINMHSRCKIMADRSNAVIRIDDNCRIHGTCIHAFESISIGKNCLIAANTQIIDGNAHDLSFPFVENRIHTGGSSKPIVIEDNVWIGANVIVLPGVTIGRGSVISAGSVVHKSIPAMVIAGGNPINIIKEFS
jgi:acetyltransferase-like isoleucine patch superfamily enzyme